MAADIHKGVVLDDRFKKALGKAQDAVEALHKLADEFNAQAHTSVGTQVTALSQLGEEVSNLRQRFADLRTARK